jgi:phosphoribosylanthranilate isomerase
VREITDAVPAFVTCVGVFVNQPREEVFETAARAGLTGIQLHGEEEAASFTGSGLRVVKALPVCEGFSLAAVTGVPESVTVLLDAHDPVRRGGTGRTIEWTVAAAAARLRPVILSGGLTPDNVGRAVAAVRPFAVDVSSGIESAPGIKDEAKMRAFFAALQP